MERVAWTRLLGVALAVAVAAVFARAELIAYEDIPNGPVGVTQHDFVQPDRPAPCAGEMDAEPFWDGPVFTTNNTWMTVPFERPYSVPHPDGQTVCPRPAAFGGGNMTVARSTHFYALLALKEGYAAAGTTATGFLGVPGDFAEAHGEWGQVGWTPAVSGYRAQDRKHGKLPVITFYGAYVNLHSDYNFRTQFLAASRLGLVLIPEMFHEDYSLFNFEDFFSSDKEILHRQRLVQASRDREAFAEFVLCAPGGAWYPLCARDAQTGRVQFLPYCVSIGCGAVLARVLGDDSTGTVAEAGLTERYVGWVIDDGSGWWSDNATWASAYAREALADVPILVIGTEVTYPTQIVPRIRLAAGDFLAVVPRGSGFGMSTWLDRYTDVFLSDIGYVVPQWRFSQHMFEAQPNEAGNAKAAREFYPELADYLVPSYLLDFFTAVPDDNTDLLELLKWQHQLIYTWARARVFDDGDAQHRLHPQHLCDAGRGRYEFYASDPGGWNSHVKGPGAAYVDLNWTFIDAYMSVADSNWANDQVALEAGYHQFGPEQTHLPWYNCAGGPSF